jgi:hypothetical protein
MIRSTTQGNAQVITDGLLLYYDIGNINSYTYQSTVKNKIYNIANSGDSNLYNQLEFGSGSSASIINTTLTTNTSVLPNPYNRVLQIGLDGYIELPNFEDFETLSANYSIEIIFRLQTLSTNDPVQENYIIKSNGNDGLYIKYSTNTDLEIGSINGGTHTYQTGILPTDAQTYYQFVFRYNKISDTLSIYWNKNIDLERKKSSLWNTFTGPIQIAYAFSSIYVAEVRLYGKYLSENEITYNFNQFKTFTMV